MKNKINIKLKPLVLYDKQRQITPLINFTNKKQYRFLNSNYLWVFLKPVPDSKFKSRLVLLILQIINPKLIISYDWLTKNQKLYYFWAKKNKKDFIVVQHGAYSGGVNTVKQCRYTRCTIMYCWSQYFTNLFKEYNKGKKVQVITFGNPIYNLYNRKCFNYNKGKVKNILILPTLLQEESVQSKYEDFIKKLLNMGYRVKVKQHPMQKKFKSFDNELLIDSDIYKILQGQEYKLVISDNSTALVDAIFFKNKVLFFDPKEHNNIYSKYLSNIYNMPNLETTYDLESYIDISAQESLLNHLGGAKTIQNLLVIPQIE